MISFINQQQNKILTHTKVPPTVRDKDKYGGEMDK